MENQNNQILNELSPLERYYYAYTNALDFEGKNKKNNSENVEKLVEKYADLKATEKLAKALSELNIPCQAVTAKKVIKNFQKGLNSKNNGHKALLVKIDDPIFSTEGIFYVDPTLDTKNSMGRTICHSLLKADEVEELLSKNGKYKIEPQTIQQISEAQELFFNCEENVLNQSNFEQIKSLLMNDEDFIQGLNFGIESLIDDVYMNKAKDESVNKYIHPYFGEGTKPWTEDLNKIFIQVFEVLFKNACKRKLNNLTQTASRELREQINEHYVDLKSDLNNAKVLVKIFSENYDGITPQVFKDVMAESIIDGDYFTENSSYFKEFNYMLNTAMAVNDYKNINTKTKMPKLSNVENALAVAFFVKGKDENAAKKLAEKVIFDSALTASTSWNIDSESAKTASPFGEMLTQMQNSKY